MRKAILVFTAIGVLAAVVLGLAVSGRFGDLPFLKPIQGMDLSAHNLKATFVSLIFLSIAGMLVFHGSFHKLLRKNSAKNNRPFRSPTNELGSGDLARKTHISPWLEKHDAFDTLIPVRNLKGSDGIVLREGNLVIPIGERNRHILTIAKTGSGKTSRMILPILYGDCLCPERSTIVIDSKPEMWQKLAAMTRKFNPNKNIMLFNPLDIARSLSWNILSKIENETDCKLIANTLVMATDNPASRADSPFFRNNALQILNAIMVGLLNDKSETLSMPRIHEIVHSGMNNLCSWLEAHPQALRSTKTFVDLARSGSQNADTILSELSMRLSAWDLQDIRATTSQTELDLESLIEKPTLFIIELRESELEMLRPLANVIVIEILRFLTKRAEQFPAGSLPRPVGLVIDEFASALGRLPDIHVKLNTLRSRNVSIVAAIQSIAQIKANYDRDADSVLAGFSTKILMPALDFQDSEWASKETGTMTVRFNTAQQGKNKRVIDVFSNQNDSISEQVQQRAVLTADEIGRPADNAATFFLPNTPVFQGHLIPYYEVPEMRKRFAITTGVADELKLREKPISYQEEAHPNELNAKNESAEISLEQLRAQLEEEKSKLGWEGTTGAAREWWLAFEEANKTNIQVILNLTKDLIRRSATITDFYKAYAKSQSTSIEQVLEFLDRELLEKTKEKLDWRNTTGPARDWWLAFEEANKQNLPLVLGLAFDLSARKSTIPEFFAAYVYSESDDVEQVLHYLDYLREEARGRNASRKQDDSNVSEIAVDTPNVTAIANGHTVSASMPQQTPAALSTDASIERASSLASQVRVSLNSKDAARNVHLQSYLEMADEILRRGKKDELRSLIGLAAEDKLLSKSDLSELERYTNQQTS